jgi:hypothetical protein
MSSMQSVLMVFEPKRALPLSHCCATQAHHADYVAMKKAHMDTEGSIQEVSIQRVQQQEDQDGEAPEVDAAEQI